MKKYFFKVLLLLLSTVPLAVCSSDNNGRGRLELEGINLGQGMNLAGIITYSDGSPAEGIVVSDGVSVVLTDADGVYQIARDPNATMVFYTLPEDCEVTIAEDGTPSFYGRIDKTKDVERHDFVLTKLPGGVEEEFTLFCFADPQVENSSHIDRMKNEMLPDVKEFAAGMGVCYGITLGDIVGDAYTLYNAMRKAFAQVPMPVFHTIGNHDHNQNYNDDKESTASYENNFGPANYGFNRGRAHIVVLDNILYTGRKNYNNGFTTEQLDWLEKHLEHVDTDKLLIVCVHIPTRNESSHQNVQRLYQLMMPYQEAHIMSGHTHYNQNLVSLGSTGIYEHVHGAVCGNWWSGVVCGDGTPNGYGVYFIKGNTIDQWLYKSTNYPADYQMRMYPVGSFNDNSGQIVANVWNADDDWTVEMFENGVKSADMTRTTDYDKGSYAYFKEMGKAEPDTPTSANSWYRRLNHIYKATPQSEDSRITIRATDRFGNVYACDEYVTDIEHFEKY